MLRVRHTGPARPRPTVEVTYLRDGTLQERDGDALSCWRAGTR